MTDLDEDRSIIREWGATTSQLDPSCADQVDHVHMRKLVDVQTAGGCHFGDDGDAGGAVLQNIAGTRISDLGTKCRTQFMTIKAVPTSLL